MVYTEVTRTKGSSGTLTSSATVGVGGEKGHARQVERVSKGKGCGDPRSPHIVLDGSKIQVQKVLHHLDLSFLIYRKEIETPFLPTQDDLHRAPTPSLHLDLAEQPNSALSLYFPATPPAILPGPGYARLFMMPCRYLSWRSSVEGDG